MTPFELIMDSDNRVFNEIQRARCEAERDSDDDEVDGEKLYEDSWERAENAYDAHKENCAGCALCEA